MIEFIAEVEDGDKNIFYTLEVTAEIHPGCGQSGDSYHGWSPAEPSSIEIIKAVIQSAYIKIGGKEFPIQIDSVVKMPGDWWHGQAEEQAIEQVGSE